MRKPHSVLSAAALVAVLALSCSAGALLAQEPAPTTEPTTTGPAPEGSVADLWRNFLHYIVLGRADAVESFGQAILSAKPEPTELYTLWVNTDRSGERLVRARGVSPKIAGIVDQLTQIINEGAKAVRMNPEEIARWIDMLGGGTREFHIASERLIEAGQYAVPQMIQRLSDVKTSEVLRDRLVVVLPRLGKEAVRPLAEALAVPEPAVREVICRTLGKIGYPEAAPYLMAVAEEKGVLDRTRVAALGAVAATAGRNALKKSPAELFYDLAVKYYEHRESVAPDARYQTANVWYWKEGLGLSYVAVPRVIFNDIYAMRTARSAVAHDPTFYPAVTLWLAAYLRKEADLPQGEKDPTQPADEPPASFYAVASGAKYLQMVLALALKDDNLAVARGAITALEKTAGAKNLVMPVAGGAPALVAALDYPNREIRYMAAEVLAKARPQRQFPGSTLVVPTLIEALRQSGTPSAMLADPDLDQRNKVKDLLRGLNVEVYDAATFGKALEAVQESGGADLVVLSAGIEGPDLPGAVAMLRSHASLRRLPVIVLASPEALPAARRLTQSDALAVIWPGEDLTPAGAKKALDEAAQKSGGSAALSVDQAAEWSVRAAQVLGMLAGTRNPVYDLTQAIPSMIAALKDQRDKVRIAAAGALAEFASAPAQQAVIELASDAQASKEVRLSAYAAAAKSVRAFGNELTERQIKDVIAAVTTKGDVEIREAAAQVLGALDLPSDQITGLISGS